MTSAGPWFGVLGPLTVRDGSVEVPIPRPQRRTLLALLLLHANQVLGVEEIIEHLWPEPPATAHQQVHALISALRRALPGGQRTVRTESTGYRLDVDTTRVDRLVFNARIADGRRFAERGDRDTAVATLREALALWRGEPFAGLPAAFLDPVRRALIEQRLLAVEQLAELELRRGRHDVVIEELAELVARYPLRDGLRRRLMLALYRDGRTPSALQVYRSGKDTLIDEYGLDPPPAVVELAERIRRADPSLDLPEHRAGAEPVPRQLPYPPAQFTGRRTELATLDTVLAGRSPAARLAVVSGPGGVGKTALATHWAHRMAEEFPDGQLYVDLRGYDPDEPLPPAEALGGFLRALGVAGGELPPDLAGRAARFRDLMDRRRMLVLLDNARDEHQVRRLLPGTPACAVIVTSRDTLAGLAAAHDACQVVVRPLPLADAVALLNSLIGPRADETAVTTALAHRCAGLPLALRIAADRGVSRPGSSLRDLVAELGDEERVLTALDSGDDPHTAVSTVFSWSYRQLRPEAARTFRLLGLHRGPHVDHAGVAALTTASLTEAMDAVDELVHAHLLAEVSSGRYAMHDLLRVWASRQAGIEDGEPLRRTALTRLADHYCAGASAAMDVLYPAERHHRPSGARTAVSPEPNRGSARDWLDVELGNLLVITGAGATDEQTVRLCATVWRHLETTGRYDEANTLSARAIEAARRRHDPTALALALTVSGLVGWRRQRYEQAERHLLEALGLYRGQGDTAGQAWTEVNLGVVYERTERYEHATEQLRAAAGRYQELGEPTGLANALGNLGVVYEQRQRYEDAIDLQKQAFALHLDTDNTAGQASALGNVGIVHHRLGRHEQARLCLRQALDLFRGLGDRAGEAEALAYLGACATALGAPESARRYLEEAVGISRELRSARLQAHALNGVGELDLASGEPQRALTCFTAALAHASEVGDREQRARSHDGMAAACHRLGQLSEAVRHWRAALVDYRRFDVRRAGAVLARLAELDALGADQP